MRSDGPVSVITGAATALGAATARLLAARGDRVVLVDVAPDELIHAAGAAWGDVREQASYVVDVRDAVAIDDAFDDIVSRFGKVAYVFCHEEPVSPCGALELGLTEWQAVIDRCVTGAYNVCRAAVGHMDRGAVLFGSSDGAITGYAQYAHYCAAMGALYSFAKSIAVELAPDIRVNSIAAGPGEVTGPTYASWGSMARPGRVEEVANVARFLLSERASYITGQLLQPDGGEVMW